jgi:hypothetical protein
MTKHIPSSLVIAAEPLQDARTLHARIEGLQALLHVQRRQIELLSERFQPSTPAGAAAERLLALKGTRQ